MLVSIKEHRLFPPDASVGVCACVCLCALSYGHAYFVNKSNFSVLFAGASL